MTTHEELRQIVANTVADLERRSRLRGWSVNVSCSCDDGGVIWWHITVGHEFLSLAPGHSDRLSRSRMRRLDGLQDTAVNAAMLRLEEAQRAALDIERRHLGSH